MPLDRKIETRLLSLLPQWKSNPDFLDDYFTDWYTMESFHLDYVERMYIKEFMEEKGYFTKSERKRINQYVYVYAEYCLHNPDIQEKLSLVRKVSVQGNDGEHHQG